MGLFKLLHSGKLMTYFQTNYLKNCGNDKHFWLFVSDEENKLYEIDTWDPYYKIIQQ